MRQLICSISHCVGGENVEMFVSYSVETEKYKRTEANPNNYLVFRIFMKKDNDKKHRIVRCRIKLSWLK